jgi:alpha/beta superfamily hydrolase
MSELAPPSSRPSPVGISPSGRVDLPVSHGRLEAILKEPEQPRRAVIVCHPHPKGGGTMNNNVVYRIAKAMEESGAAVLRFNFRGVGRSTGEYGEGIAEAEDVQVALDFMAARHPSVPLWLAGFSFGARVGLSAGIADRRVSALLAVGLALKVFDLSFLERERGGKPLAIIQAAQDEYGEQPDIEKFVARIPEPRRLWIVDEATHLFPGRLDPLEAAVTTAITWLTTPPTP